MCVMEVISRKDVVNPTLTWIKRRSGRRFPITVCRLDIKTLTYGSIVRALVNLIFQVVGYLR
jgi:hypothetical protein